MTLQDTVALMAGADFKDRFKAEYYQLKIRQEALCKMIFNYHSGKLSFTPMCPIELLEIQERIMREYLDVLELRAKVERIEL